jgi:hypothetical protein
VNHELVYSIDGTQAVPAAQVSLAAVGLLERTHLQASVLAHPEILGDEAKIVTFEFDRWTDRGGGQPADRLDVLAVDRTGRLIVAELKRDKAPDTTTMQAINYAAMVSRFSLDTLAEVHARYLGGATTTDSARAQLQDWAPDISDETLAPPRIVLLASEFGPTLTNTALFLFEARIDIRLRRYQLFETRSGERMLWVSQVLPVPDAEEFMVKPRSGTATQAGVQARRERRASIPARIVASKALDEGAELTIAVPPGVQEDRAAIEAWLAERDDRGRARWRGDSQNPVTWVRDNRVYNLTSLIRIIITSATGSPPRTQVWGPNWFHDERGQTLAQVADAIPSE